MHRSPLTLHKVSLLKLSVEPEISFEGNRGAEDFDFAGTWLGTDVKCTPINREGQLQQWYVTLAFKNDNAKDKKCPYSIEAVAIGIFSVAEAFPTDRTEQLVYENGAALVYGAIREIVASITARSVLGQLVLPTGSFVGDYKTAKEKNNALGQKESGSGDIQNAPEEAPPQSI